MLKYEPLFFSQRVADLVPD
jgi:hypothetical protein